MWLLLKLVSSHNPLQSSYDEIPLLSFGIASASKKIKSHQLLSSLKKTSSLQVQTLKKQLAKVNKHQAVLHQPLQKPQAEKVLLR